MEDRQAVYCRAAKLCLPRPQMPATYQQGYSVNYCALKQTYCKHTVGHQNGVVYTVLHENGGNELVAITFANLDQFQ